MYTYLGLKRILILDSTLVAWSEGKCVLVHVEEDILLDHGRHLHPLLCGGVHVSGVVSECVQEYEGTLEDFSDVLHGFGEVGAVMQRFRPMQIGLGVG